MNTTKNIISLFSGALGLDLGLENAGLVLKAAVECERFTVQTIKNNRKHLKSKKLIIIDKPLTLENIGEICKDVLQKTELKKNDRCILVGGPPCQPFSTAGKRASLKDIRSCGLRIFLEAVRILRPKFFVIENVKGILSAAKRHRPLAERGPGFPPLSPDEEHGSAFQKILNDLKKICKDLGYCVSWGVMNSADYGAPQTRERVIFIGSLDGHFVWPESTHSQNGEDGKKKWVTLKDGLKGLKEKRPRYLEFNRKVCNYLKLIPEGSNWRSLPKKLWSKAIGGAYKSWGGRSGFLRRLSWNRPSPTITNNPKTKATMLCHPTEIRPLSVRECARLQQFPDYWDFTGSTAAQYRQVGNATPLSLGHAIGTAIRNAARKKGKGPYRRRLYCSDPKLLERIIRRPKTILNPPRMRKNKSTKQAIKWLNGSANKRTFFKRYQAISAA
jgi:DNA (cytosine-5)-methyltransferase 1